MKALLPGIGFSTPSTNAKEGEEGGRRKWEGERGTWPDFQSCGINVHLSESCARAEPLPRGYLKIGCGGPNSHAHPCKFFAPRCLVKATPNQRCCCSDGSTLHQLPPEAQHPGHPQSITGRAAASGAQDHFPFPALSTLLNGLFAAPVWEVLSESKCPLCQMEADSLTGSQEG